MKFYDVKQEPFGGLTVARMHTERFGCDMDVILRGDEALLSYAERCAAYFEALPDDVAEQLEVCSLRYYEDMKQFCPSDDPDFPFDVTREKLGDFIKPRCLIVRKPPEESVIGFGVELDCAWEKAHGLEWVIRGGEVLYVGDFMGVSPWYEDFVYETDCRSYVDENFTIDW